MATRRKLDDALDYGRQLQSVHELQDGGASASLEDIVAILDVSEVDADAQPKKITLQELVNAGGGGTPAGNAGEIQINDGADPPNLGTVTDFKWDSVDGALDVPGDINLDDGGTYSTTLQTITPTADRVISFPDATGTVALVGGSSGQLVYNSAGAYVGTPTLTYDGSILTSSGRFINSYNATASSPAKAFTGTWFTGGTATTTKPQVLIEPSGTTSTAWSTSGTGFGVNAASGFAGNLLDLQVSGTSRLIVGSTGNAVDAPLLAAGASRTWIPSTGAWAFGGSSGGPGLYVEGALGFGTTRDALIWWTGVPSSGAYSQRDVVLARDAAGTLAQRNGTNAQTYRLYNTYTDASNYERAKLSWESNVFRIGVEKGSSGGTARSFELQTDGITRVQVQANQSQVNFLDVSGTALVNITSAISIGIRVANGYGYTFTPAAANANSPDAGFYRDSAGVIKITDGSTGVGYLKTTPVAVSALPAAATVGAGTRGFVNDSTVAASGNFGAIVAGGGANNVPVFSDGTNWLIG